MQEREQLALADRDPAALVIDAAMGRELVEHYASVRRRVRRISELDRRRRGDFPDALRTLALRTGHQPP